MDGKELCGHRSQNEDISILRVNLIVKTPTELIEYVGIVLAPPMHEAANN